MTDWCLTARRFNGGERKVASRSLYIGVLYLGYSRSICYETCLASCEILSSCCDSISVNIEQESSD